MTKIAEAPRTASGYYEARPGDVAGRDDLLLVDVREPDELVGELGHIHGITHVPMAELLAAGLPHVPQDRAVVLVCRSGNRSGQCAAHLAARGHAEVYNLVGGMMRWRAEERPSARTPTWKKLGP
jgi:hydroxyacylglutathione hydrolase